MNIPQFDQFNLPRLLQLLHRGEVACVELTESCLARIEQHEKNMHGAWLREP